MLQEDFDTQPQLTETVGYIASWAPQIALIAAVAAAAASNRPLYNFPCSPQDTERSAPRQLLIKSALINNCVVHVRAQQVR